MMAAGGVTIVVKSANEANSECPEHVFTETRERSSTDGVTSALDGVLALFGSARHAEVITAPRTVRIQRASWEWACS